MDKSGFIKTIILLLLVAVLAVSTLTYFKLTSDSGLDLNAGNFEVNVKYNDSGKITGKIIDEHNQTADENANNETSNNLTESNSTN